MSMMFKTMRNANEVTFSIKLTNAVNQNMISDKNNCSNYHCFLEFKTDHLIVFPANEYPA